MSFVNDAQRSQGRAYQDPITSAALAGYRSPDNDYAPEGLGLVDPATITATASFVSSAVNGIRKLFGGGGGDPAAQIWKAIPPEAHLVLTTLNVRVGPDGKWYDQGGQLLSSEDADYRAESLMARLINATMKSDRYWYDNDDNHRLSSPEAYARWTTAYGPNATLESVLASGQTYAPQSVPPHNLPDGEQIYGTPYRPVPSPGGTTRIVPRTGGTAQIAGFTVNPWLLAGVAGAVLLVAMKGRRR